MILGALIGAGASLVGGFLNSRSQSRANRANIAATNYANERNWQENRWAVSANIEEARRAEAVNIAEARRAEQRADEARKNTFVDLRAAAIAGGFNPLTALGSGAMPSQSQFPVGGVAAAPVSGAFFNPALRDPVTGMGDAIATAGSIVADAVQAATLERAKQSAEKAKTAMGAREVASTPLRLAPVFDSASPLAAHLTKENQARQGYVNSRIQGEKFKVDFPVTLMSGKEVLISRGIAADLKKQPGDYLYDSDISSTWGFGTSEAIANATPWLQREATGRPEVRPVQLPNVSVPLDRAKQWWELGADLAGQIRKSLNIGQWGEYEHQQQRPYNPLRLNIAD